MLREHPHIQRVRIMETITDAGIMQRLIVETDINLSEHRSKHDKQELAKLKAYLSNLALNDFGDFNEIEIRPFDEEGEYDSSMIA